MKRFCTAALVLVFLTAAALANAADKPDPTGTWKWTVTFGQNSREVTLKLKLDGDKLTGTCWTRQQGNPHRGRHLQGRRPGLQGRPRAEGEQDDPEVHRQAQRRHDQGKGRVRSQRPAPKPRLGSQESQGLGMKDKGSRRKPPGHTPANSYRNPKRKRGRLNELASPTHRPYDGACAAIPHAVCRGADPLAAFSPSHATV